MVCFICPRTKRRTCESCGLCIVGEKSVDKPA